MSSNHKPSGRAEFRRGYFTPEPSLGPDVARNQAEKDRQTTIAEVTKESTQNGQGSVTEGGEKHQIEEKKKVEGKSIETERSLGPDSARNQAKRNLRATVEDEPEQSIENSAKGKKKEKKKGKGKSVKFLPQPDKVETEQIPGSNSTGNQAKRDLRVTIEDEPKESTKNSAKEKKKRKRKVKENRPSCCYHSQTI